MSDPFRTAAGPDLEFRAGGTDIEARRRIGRVAPQIVDLIGREGLSDWSIESEGARFGAMTRIARLASAEVMAAYPALALTAGSLANPHTRAVGTLGGNLAQQTRCRYYRTGAIECHMTGGSRCPARGNIDDWAVVFDRGPCIAPHPSSLGMALLAYDATVEIHGGDRRPIDAVFGDGSDPHRPNALEPGELIVAIELPGPTGERAAYWRTNARTYAEWPIVEAVARLVVSGGEIVDAAVAVGGVAPVPLRLHHVDRMLRGSSVERLDRMTLAVAATEGVDPLAATRSKVALLARTVVEVVDRAIEGGSEAEVGFHERWV